MKGRGSANPNDFLSISFSWDNLKLDTENKLSELPGWWWWVGCGGVLVNLSYSLALSELKNYRVHVFVATPFTSSSFCIW